MQFPKLAIALAALLFFPIDGGAQTARITSVDPLTARADDVVSANGSEIGSANVDDLYLTNDVQDVKAEMLEQSDKLVKLKVPADVKSGQDSGLASRS